MVGIESPRRIADAREGRTSSVRYRGGGHHRYRAFGIAVLSQPDQSAATRGESIDQDDGRSFERRGGIGDRTDDQGGGGLARVFLPVRPYAPKSVVVRHTRPRKDTAGRSDVEAPSSRSGPLGRVPPRKVAPPQVRSPVRRPPEHTVGSDRVAVLHLSPLHGPLWTSPPSEHDRHRTATVILPQRRIQAHYRTGGGKVGIDEIGVEGADTREGKSVGTVGQD
mmetsp:Transcript_36400/g.109277  ORF Transcript_36400/g.109277 Transcript_36400/m.109277 type:complete len:222 (+) Transcript_36400:1295-1960(+)